MPAAAAAAPLAVAARLAWLIALLPLLRRTALPVPRDIPVSRTGALGFPDGGAQAGKALLEQRPRLAPNLGAGACPASPNRRRRAAERPSSKEAKQAPAGKPPCPARCLQPPASRARRHVGAQRLPAAAWILALPRGGASAACACVPYFTCGCVSNQASAAQLVGMVTAEHNAAQNVTNVTCTD